MTDNTEPLNELDDVMAFIPPAICKAGSEHGIDVNIYRDEEKDDIHVCVASLAMNEAEPPYLEARGDDEHIFTLTGCDIFTTEESDLLNTAIFNIIKTKQDILKNPALYPLHEPEKTKKNIVLLKSIMKKIN